MYVCNKKKEIVMYVFVIIKFSLISFSQKAAAFRVRVSIVQIVQWDQADLDLFCVCVCKKKRERERSIYFHALNLLLHHHPSPSPNLPIHKIKASN